MKRPGDWIFVRNNSDTEFSSKYDGEDVVIAPGEFTEIPAAAATLLFGFGAPFDHPDRIRALRRLGWIATHDDRTSALERLKKFSFHVTEHEARSEKNPASAPRVVEGAEEDSSESTSARTPVRQPPAPNNLLGKLGAAQAAG